MSQKNHRQPQDERGRLPHLLRIDELAERLGVSVRHLRRLVQERRIPSLKVGHFVMFDEDEIAGWLEQCRRPAEAGQPWAPLTGRCTRPDARAAAASTTRR